MKPEIVDKMNKMALVLGIAICTLLCCYFIFFLHYTPPVSNYYNDISNPRLQCNGDGLTAFIPKHMLNKNYSYVVFYGNFSTEDVENTWRMYMRENNGSGNISFITARCQS